MKKLTEHQVIDKRLREALRSLSRRCNTFEVDAVAPLGCQIEIDRLKSDLMRLIPMVEQWKASKLRRIPKEGK